MSGSRRAAVVVALGLVAVTAGCLGVLTGSEPLAFAANGTVVEDAALRDAGYEEGEHRTIGRTFNASVGGGTRQVTIRNELYRYNRTVPAGSLTTGNGSAGTGVPTNRSGAAPSVSGAAQFAVLSSPDASVAGQSVNPLADLSARELVERFSVSNAVRNLTFDGNRSVRILGQRRTVSAFRAEATGIGPATRVRVHVTSFEHEGDLVVAIAVHPELLDERDRVDRLLGGLKRT
ncbi:MAG: DUF6517 family protein [Haloarculaceae archaeon]